MVVAHEFFMGFTQAGNLLQFATLNMAIDMS